MKEWQDHTVKIENVEEYLRKIARSIKQRVQSGWGVRFDKTPNSLTATRLQYLWEGIRAYIFQQEAQLRKFYKLLYDQDFD